MADIKYLDKTGLGTVKSILEGLFSPKGHKHTVADITNFPSSLPASDVYSWAKAETKPVYAFNEINPGNATIGDGANSLFLRTNASWASSIYHHTSSDEAVVFLNKGKNVNNTANYTTSWIFAYGTPADRPAWTSLTPVLQIKGECVAINKLIGSQKGGSYNLDVNGSANATTLYENGTRVALSGHNHDDRYYTEGEIDTKLSGKSNTGHGHSGIGDGALVHMCSLQAKETYNAYKIITNWNKASNYMPTINIRGYAYGSQKTIDCDIVMYHYNSEPCNYSITNKGSYDIKVYSAIENNVQVFYIEPGEYFGMFNVFVYGGMGTGNFTGWTMETSSAVSGTELPKNAIATNITGNAGSATKLETARTITIGNTGKSFNGQSNISWTLSEIGAAASHDHPYLPLTGGTMEGNVTWKTGTGLASCFPAHIYRNTYDNDGNVYDHYYKSDTLSTNSFANLRVKSGTSFKLLRFGGDGTFTWDSKAVSLAGHGHTKSQITDFPSSLPANGGNADTVGGKGVSDFARFYLSPMSSGAPADSAKSWFTDTMPSGSGAIVYNVPGAEKTIIAGKSSGAFGHMLQLNYDDNYLRILRYYSGSWKTTDWEKISAGYADTAGSAVDQTARNSAAAKWTWNADEIKAVKVNNASSADNATKATQDSDGNTINSTYLKLEGGTMTGNILLGNGNAILGSGNSIPSKFKDSASISPEVHSVWLAAVGTGTGNAAGSEASGILFDGNTIKMWSPLDADPQIIDSDTGAAYTLLHSGNISSHAITSLSGYATQDWVTNKGYTTATGHTHGYWTWDENTIKGVKVNNAGYADSAGSVEWTDVSNKPTTLAGYGITDSVALLKSTNDFVHSSNEWTVVPNAYSGALWLNYRTCGGTNGNITAYNFGDGKGGSLASISSGQFSGNAATATSATKATQDSDGNTINSTYLKLSGGTMTGSIIHSGLEENGKRILYGKTRNSGIKYDYQGNECLMISSGTYAQASMAFYTCNKLSLNDSNNQWVGSSPDMHIKNGCVHINKIIANGSNATYNLDVNGSANATTLYENGTRVSVSGHSHSNYMENYISVNNKNMNTIKTPGVYYGYNMSNAGVTDISNFIILNYSNDWGTQLQFSAGSSRAFCRFWQNAGGVMQSTWKEFSFAGHGTHISSGAQTWAGVKTFSSAPVFSAGFSSSANVTISGSVTASSGFFDTSDERLKDFYDDIDVDFDKLKAIPKKYFSWKDDENKEIHLGTSAQEIQKVYPEIVNESATGELSVDYSKLSVVALAAVDKLYDKINRIEQALIDKGIL